MKESVFNNYQEINHLFSVNFRKLVAEDCELISDSGFIIDENKILKRELRYSLLKPYVQEIKDFFKLLESKKGFANFNSYMFNSDFNRDFEEVMTNIKLKKEVRLDFRGCKTQEDRGAKFLKLKKQIEFYESEKFSLIDEHLNRAVNSGIEQIVNFINEKTETEIVEFITSDKAVENLNDSVFLDLSREIHSLSSEISDLSKKRQDAANKLQQLKKTAVQNRLTSKNYTIDDDFGNKYTLSEKTIEKLNNALNSSFSNQTFMKI